MISSQFKGTGDVIHLECGKKPDKAAVEKRLQFLGYDPVFISAALKNQILTKEVPRVPEVDK